jgi:hypothetical protein
MSFTDLFVNVTLELVDKPPIRWKGKPFNYKVKMVRIGGGLGWYEEDEDPKYTEYHTISVAGEKITFELSSFGRTEIDMIILLINKVTDDKGKTYPKAHKWITANLNAIKKSIFYLRYEHCKKLADDFDKKIERMKQSQQNLRAAQSAFATEFIKNKQLTNTERDMVMKEYGYVPLE